MMDDEMLDETDDEEDEELAKRERAPKL